MLSKTELRKELRVLRQTSVKYIDFWKFGLDTAYGAFDILLNGQPVVAGYQPLGSEVDPGPLLARAAGKGCQTALPFIAGRTDDMEFRHWNMGDSLEKGVFGFRQPLVCAKGAIPTLLIVPLLGFDRNMNRIGQGAGHYDRYFSRNINAIRIGLSYSSQELPSVPIDRWDAPMDAILTENGWITGPHSRINLS